MITKPRKAWASLILLTTGLVVVPTAVPDPLTPIDHDIRCPTCVDPDRNMMEYVRYALGQFNMQHPGATFIGGVVPGWINYRVRGSFGGPNDWVLVALSREPDLGNVLGLDGDVLYQAISAGGFETGGTFQAGEHFTPPGDDSGGSSGGGSGGGGGGGDCGDNPKPIP